MRTLQEPERLRLGGAHLSNEASGLGCLHLLERRLVSNHRVASGLGDPCVVTWAGWPGSGKHGELVEARTHVIRELRAALVTPVSSSSPGR
jgi:hypothetical protein